MASSSSQQGARSEGLIPSSEAFLKPNLDQDPEKLAIWNSRVMIPFTLENREYAFLGPYNGEHTIALSALFPSSASTQIAATRGKLDTSFFNKVHDFFRCIHPEDKTAFKQWFKRLEPTRGQSWKDLGFYDLLKLSTKKIKYNFPMLAAAMYFWHPATCTFHTPVGMIGPSLYEVAVITGLRPDGPVPDFPQYEKDQMGDLWPNIKPLSFSKFMTNNKGAEGSVPSDREHIAFLAYWLSRYYLCSRTVSVTSSAIVLAAALHHGDNFALGPCLLASLFDSLTHAHNQIMAGSSPTNYCGPLWFLQLWMNAVFSRRMKVKPPQKDHVIKGSELRLYTPQLQSQDWWEQMAECATWFLELNYIEDTWAPFMERGEGPDWLRGPLTRKNADEQLEVHQTWLSILKPRLIIPP